jgi:hypothetical protein
MIGMHAVCQTEPSALVRIGSLTAYRLQMQVMSSQTLTIRAVLVITDTPCHLIPCVTHAHYALVEGSHQHTINILLGTRHEDDNY